MKAWCLSRAVVLIAMMGSRFIAAFESAVLVTGSTDGIGVTTAKNMALQGFHVLVHGRDEGRIRKAEQAIKSFVQKRSGSENKARILPLPAADLSTVQGTRQLANDVIRTCQEEDLDLKVLMNNAGVYSEDHVITNDGTELTFAVNVVAPFVLTSRLLPTMLLDKDGNKKKQRRIVIASSISQCGSIRDWDDLVYERRRYSAHGAYSESKLLDAMLTFEFAERFKTKGIHEDIMICNCLDPGTVNTKMLLVRAYVDPFGAKARVKIVPVLITQSRFNLSSGRLGSLWH